MALNQELFEWVDALCVEAMGQARNGDTLLVNELSRNPAWMYYFNNVHTTKSISQDTFSHSYPHFVKALESFKESYEATANSEARLTTIEAKLDKLMALVLAEGKAVEAEAPKPKRKRGKKAKEEPVVEVEVEDATTTSTTEVDVETPEAEAVDDETEEIVAETEADETEDDASEGADESEA